MDGGRIGTCANSCVAERRIRTCHKNGEDGFLCQSTEEWYEVIKKLVEDRELRKQIGEAAYQRVLKEYTTATVEQDVVDALIHR